MLHLTDVRSGLPVYEALASEVRISILELIMRHGEINLKQLAKELNLSSGAITAHIKKLQDAKLIKVSSRSAVRGAQKVCTLLTDKVVVDVYDSALLARDMYQFDIGIGQYTDFDVSPTCGVVIKDVILGELDDPRYFAFPERFDARLLWFMRGHLTWQLPNSLKLGQTCTELQIDMELASEAPGFSAIYPADISFRLNGVDLGFFTSPGEFNDRKGIFTPEWWFPNLGQYGKLKMLTINDRGSFIDGLCISDVTISDLDISHRSMLDFTIEVKEDAVNPGGVSIFGKGFGDYDSGITVRMFYQKNASE